MNREDVVNMLYSYKEKNTSLYHLTKIGLFGSYARNEATEDSDIDIVVELLIPDLFVLGSIKTDLEELFGKYVDIVRLRQRMNKLLLKRIESDAIYV